MRLACFMPGGAAKFSHPDVGVRPCPVRAKTPGTPLVTSRGTFAAFRLLPGEDLTAGLRRAQQQSGARAMAVLTCVGSLTQVTIRHANRSEGTSYRGHFEITSLTGTLDPEGEHLHLTITDGEGRAFGGHLLPGSSIYTTAEIVTILLPDMAFTREPCPLSGYDELVVTTTLNPEGARQ